VLLIGCFLLVSEELFTRSGGDLRAPCRNSFRCCIRRAQSLVCGFTRCYRSTSGSPEISVNVLGNTDGSQYFRFLRALDRRIATAPVLYVQLCLGRPAPCMCSTLIRDSRSILMALPEGHALGVLLLSCREDLHGILRIYSAFVAAASVKISNSLSSIAGTVLSCRWHWSCDWLGQVDSF